MGQAKQRGTFEERQTKAVEREAESKALKDAQRRAQERIYNAAYRSGMVEPAKRPSAGSSKLLAAALMAATGGFK
jgi:hypothetical protein